MKQIAQNYRSGKLAVVDAPVPACKPGGVLVRTAFSLVSMGTEMMKVHEGKLSLLGKARARPDQVKKIAHSLARQGLLSTYRKVMSRLDSLTPLGYSLSGTIVDVGSGVREFTVGQRAACGGNMHSLHAEYNWVPTNLCVAIPDAVPSELAAFTTVGAVAMQGFRQAEAKLGEVAVVIGLGLIGQLLTQILRAAGLHVFGIDVDQDRCRLAEKQGALAASEPTGAACDALIRRLFRQSHGAGADHVFLAAGGDTNQPVELAVKVTRDRARITDIGKCRLDLPWNDFYEKELDLRFSRSYGPGRYDPRYEEGGVDYPIGYVRWTERRNMECFVSLLASGRIDLQPLISAVLPFDEAVGAYEQMNSGQLSGLGVLFRYPDGTAGDRHVDPSELSSSAPGPRPVAARDKVRIGMIGCGRYAQAMILPHLRSRKDVDLVEVVTTRSLSAVDARSKFSFARASTDAEHLLADNDIDAVMIMTRHASHAALAGAALSAGKAVFVEKPLAVDVAQLKVISDIVRKTGNDRIMVGFNRRFAPLLADLKASWGPRGGPCTINYTVNAGQLEATSWYAQADTEGSRFIGEGCHFVDAISWWLDADPCDVFASRAADDPDAVTGTLRYPDGSIATIVYVTQGDQRYPKETIEIFGEGKVARLHDFSRSELWRGGRRRVKRSMSLDKGQKHELEAFIGAVKRGAPMPIPLDSLVASTAATFAVVRSAATRCVEPVDGWLRHVDDTVELSHTGAAS
jgi:predicted dehydrogenase/threonine dehydrogenase-like Zn-dependent dehydrogenase